MEKSLSGLIGVVGVSLLTGCPTPRPEPYIPPPPAIVKAEPTNAELAINAYHAKNYETALKYSELVLSKNPNSETEVFIKLNSFYNLNRYEDFLDFYESDKDKLSDSEKELAVTKQAALVYFKIESGKLAYKTFKSYAQRKGKLSQDDYYWGGAIADVNLLDQERDSYWSKLSLKNLKKYKIK